MLGGGRTEWQGPVPKPESRQLIHRLLVRHYRFQAGTGGVTQGQGVFQRLKADTPGDQIRYGNGIIGDQ